MGSNQQNLKPCPFCGREAKMDSTSGWEVEYFVCCSDPTMMCPASRDVNEGDTTEELAAMRWNFRQGDKTPHGPCSKCEAGFGEEEVGCMWLKYMECGRPEGPYGK